MVYRVLFSLCHIAPRVKAFFKFIFAAGIDALRADFLIRGGDIRKRDCVGLTYTSQSVSCTYLRTRVHKDAYYSIEIVNSVLSSRAFFVIRRCSCVKTRETIRIRFRREVRNLVRIEGAERFSKIIPTCRTYGRCGCAYFELRVSIFVTLFTPITFHVEKRHFQTQTANCHPRNKMLEGSGVVKLKLWRGASFEHQSFLRRRPIIRW